MITSPSWQSHGPFRKNQNLYNPVPVCARRKARRASRLARVVANGIVPALACHDLGKVAARAKIQRMVVTGTSAAMIPSGVNAPR